MNQSVIFNEQVRWLAKLDALEFIAQLQGNLIKCRVSRRYLQQFSELNLHSEHEIVNAFECQRFDLEDMAETLITEEAFDGEGNISLG
ncbi:DUF1488 domain-containing protein [Shewanella yunxiaonensis]|uniref:DUF1488 domain-containing protein n=1 Tax=Shewanella yunxiaonensis TaxID=2829809 RepID=A0ABX7YT52_9GAMM|nr:MULTISPECIES: DUF1488 domain-containing protein [Shewanella]MDF0535378.1 DUF1488 domain-containing protein [Shewanella sp. A32]QUN05949.1 DUF1488 domain-containing protein [Shewanella yunxiaonensis]